jgi:hypothetical protein
MRSGKRTDRVIAKGVTPEKVMTWALRKSHVPNAQVAKILDISPQTSTRYFHDMEDFVGREFDANVLRQNLMGLYGKAVMALEGLIDDKNPTAVIAFFKGQGIWVDKSEVKSTDTDKASTTDLLRKLEKIGVPVVGDLAEKGEEERAEDVN